MRFAPARAASAITARQGLKKRNGGTDRMNDISELERGAAAKVQEAPVANSIDIDVLKAELEAERLANAQLTERVRAIKEKQETMVVALEKKVARLTQQLEANGTELQHQRKLNVDLTAINRKLSEAARTGLIDAETLNQSMETELAALRVARSAEMAEVEEIMAELRPLIGEVA
jgi:hypothetical protein